MQVGRQRQHLVQFSRSMKTVAGLSHAKSYLHSLIKM
jgi:hypothetical protein